MESAPLVTRVIPQSEIPPDIQELQSHPLIAASRNLIGRVLAIHGETGDTEAEIVEIEAFSEVGPAFQKRFDSKPRSEGEWFSAPVRQSHVHTVVVDPKAKSVLRIKTVSVNGERTALAKLIKELLPGENLDGQALPSSHIEKTHAIHLEDRTEDEVLITISTGNKQMLAIIAKD